MKSASGWEFIRVSKQLEGKMCQVRSKISGTKIVSVAIGPLCLVWNNKGKSE